MEAILDLTCIPRIIEGRNKLLIQNLSSPETNQRDVRSWYDSVANQTSINSSNIQKILAIKAFDRLQGWFEGASDLSVYKQLVDEEALNALGLDVNFIGKCFQEHNNNTTQSGEVGLSAAKKNEAAYLALFLNSLGLMPSSAVQCVLMFHGTWSSKDNIPQQNGTSTHSGSSDTTTDYWASMVNLSKLQVSKMSEANIQLHREGSSFKTILERQVSSLKSQLLLLFSEPSFTSEAILNEICIQHIEPCYAVCKFQEAVASYRDVTSVQLSRRDIMQYEAMLQSRKVNVLNGQRNHLTDSLFQIILGKRYRIKNGSTMAAMDVILNVLLGASLCDMQKVHSILTFAFVEGCTYSDDLIETINLLEHQVAQYRTDTDLWKVLVRTWTQSATFVIYLEMIRLLIAQISDVGIGCVDDFLNEDCMVKGVRQLANRHIYFLRGFYYFKDVKSLNVDCRNGIKSTNYKDLLIHIWLNTTAIQEPSD